LSVDQDAAIQSANQYGGNGNENSSLFSSALSFLGNMNKDDTDVDEDDVQRKHDEAYNKGNASNMSSGAIGR
jgi:hypothetical protein